MEAILKGNSIHKVFGAKNNIYTALQHVDVTINKGEFVGIMGPSGAGKTTLLNILSTIDKPTSGSIVIGGESVDTMKEKDLAKFRRKHLGFIFQDYNLLDSLTIQENILLPLSLANWPAQKMEVKVREIANILGIEAILNSYPYQVSGGQKQRAAVARAIITNPSLVLADEPTGALDSKSSTDLLNTFNVLNKDYDSTILMVTHDAFAASYCNRVLFMKDGRLFTEIVRGDKDRKEFLNLLLNTLSTVGGGTHEHV
ncbi:ABC transporter ATP-binding protein [Viridibacillus sp. NPDC096237]|uniref:ABC transporter ATP-binding protein n=1 Tax=Viridibacillus sp. NPDC096237 TaxID=3390721 RepID=UPI003D0799CF